MATSRQTSMLALDMCSHCLRIDIRSALAASVSPNGEKSTISKPTASTLTVLLAHRCPHFQRTRSTLPNCAGAKLQTMIPLKFLSPVTLAVHRPTFGPESFSFLFFSHCHGFMAIFWLVRQESRGNPLGCGC